MKELAKKLSEVMAACSYVQKDKKNKDQNYNYVSAAAVLDHVNEELTKRGLCTKVESSIIGTDIFTSKSGTTFQRIIAQVIVTLIDSKSGETMTFNGIGCGSDTNDKAAMKAQTAALKYAWMMTLNISTGDDPETDEKADQEIKKQPPVSNPSPPQNNQNSTAKPPKNDQVFFKAKKENEDGTVGFEFVPVEKLSPSQLKWYATLSKDTTLRAAAQAYIKANFPSES